MDKPLKSTTHGQCDATPTVTFPAASFGLGLAYITGHTGSLRGHAEVTARSRAFLERQFARFDANILRLSGHVSDHLVRSVGVPAGQRQAGDRDHAHRHRVADKSGAGWRIR